MGLDHELLHAVHEVVDLRHHQAAPNDGLEQCKRGRLAAGRLHVPKRPLQQEAQLLRARLRGQSGTGQPGDPASGRNFPPRSNAGIYKCYCLVPDSLWALEIARSP